MNMSQLIIGTALGFFVAQGALYGIRGGIGWLQRDQVRQQTSESGPSQESDLIGAFIRHAGLIGASAALITLGVWSVKDYLATTSAHNAAIADTFEPATGAAEAAGTQGTALVAAAPVTAPEADASVATAHDIDPYADPDFQVHRRSHHPGSLKEKLVQQSEARARAELLTETQQHVHRSQYDCEAAERASKYVKVGLDVWGFASWQGKYFPAEGYKGARLSQCRDIKNVVDPSWVNLRSTVAQTSQPVR